MATIKTKILMIEDERDLAGIYSLQMKMSGINVVLASNGAEALEILQKQSFDLVLLDLLMPDIDGFEMLRQIKGDNKLKKNKVYAWSNLTQKKQIELAKKCGADGFLIKSEYTPSSLVEKVNELLK
ncbi:MAG: response regulator [Patescibacteria group bacterium]|jgi:CheY-like chemotaxis protein